MSLCRKDVSVVPGSFSPITESFPAVLSFVLLDHLLQGLPALQEAIEERRSKAVSRGLTVQGFLIRVIESETRQYYFVLDCIKYHFTTVIGALDCLIKSHLSYNLKYSFENKYMYTLIQRVIYRIETPGDERSPNMALFTTQMKV